MATLFFSRNGRSETRANQGERFPVAELADAYSDHNLVFFSEPPVFNPDKPDHDMAKHKFVVISVDADEVSEKFDKEGYYFVINETPEQAADRLNIIDPVFY